MEVTESNFESAVLDRSHSLPVVVDFWAEWCAPCRQLGPILEREASKRSGSLELVKVDVDANPTLSRSYGIQGIPAVKAFHRGRVTAGFVGAQPATAVERFLDSLLPSEAELLAHKGDEESLRAALQLEPGHAAAAIQLARILHGRGQKEEALEILGNVRGSFAAEGLAARIKIERTAALDLSRAFAALDAGDNEQALDVLIEAITPASSSRDEIRRVVVGILDELGLDDPLVTRSRTRLASALY
ncbi:MAG: tetratricopeptide repeat protein [Candidatus Dormibacteraeota bacterium]|nr:tetratricopeptide repeat protein [Candidatus Dormibacteraeota bacterium]